VIAGAGYFVWQKQGSKSASAANWTDLSGVNGVSLKDDSRITACKSSVNTDSGKSWVVKLQAHNENYIGDFNGSFEVKRDGVKIGEVLLSAKPYAVGKVQTTSFRIEQTDTWTGYISFRAGVAQSFAGPWSFDKIADC
jgi:hypothetical protein